jgi:hypothetical protein
MPFTGWDGLSHGIDAPSKRTSVTGNGPSAAGRSNTWPEVPIGSTGIACASVLVWADCLVKASQLRGMPQVSNVPHRTNTISATSRTGRVTKGMNVHGAQQSTDQITPNDWPAKTARFRGVGRLGRTDDATFMSMNRRDRTSLSVSTTRKTWKSGPVSQTDRCTAPRARRRAPRAARTAPMRTLLSIQCRRSNICVDRIVDQRAFECSDGPVRFFGSAGSRDPGDAGDTRAPARRGRRRRSTRSQDPWRLARFRSSRGGPAWGSAHVLST